jgi:hypothetical protein
MMLINDRQVGVEAKWLWVNIGAEQRVFHRTYPQFLPHGVGPIPIGLFPLRHFRGE